jgi:hypothetical protein
MVDFRVTFIIFDFLTAVSISSIFSDNFSFPKEIFPTVK